jgi:hypothetical protein
MKPEPLKPARAAAPARGRGAGSAVCVPTSSTYRCRWNGGLVFPQRRSSTYRGPQRHHLARGDQIQVGTIIRLVHQGEPISASRCRGKDLLVQRHNRCRLTFTRQRADGKAVRQH